MFYFKNRINTLTFIIILFLTLFNFQDCFSEKNTEIKILKKIDNQIITNIDVKKEFNYLIALNKNLETLPYEEAIKIANEFLTREIIKINEIKKFIDIKNLKDDVVLEKIISNIIENLNLKDISDLKKHLLIYDLTIEDLKSKMLIEVLWNQLINSRFKDKININKDNLISRIKNENLLKNDIIEYNLSEIFFQANNQTELTNKTKIINENISSQGFKNTANKFSVSDTAKLGGFIGRVNENQLSNTVKSELANLNINEHTKPINTGSGFLILFINDRKTIEQIIDEKTLLNNMIQFERQKQLENFSQIYFNKIKINSTINEY